MRKFAAILVSLTLLTVSSAPMVSAEACEMPQHARSAVMGHGGMDMAMAMDGMPMMVMAMDDDHASAPVQFAGSQSEGACRIECGCGCHDSIDALPHLLAPHSTGSASFNVFTASLRVMPQATAILSASVPLLFSPPPKTC